ncbi:MAG: paraquat-inducible protein [Planctomycetota bacterium]|nr:MAG: paraquat-inducible protein [Planctomycetota bacterium]
MSKSAYLRIGIFVIAAVLVGSGGLVLFGSGVFREEGIMVETYLNEAVPGLATGSQVKYRGVPVGAVVSVSFAYQTYGEGSGGEAFAESGKYVVVRMEIDKRAFKDRSGIHHDPKEVIDLEVKRGLRASYAKDLIGSLAYMEFNYVAEKKKVIDGEKAAGLDDNAPVNEFPGGITITWKPEYIEIPSVPSAAMQLISKAETVVTSLADARIEDVAADVRKAINEVTRLITEDLSPVLKNVNTALTELSPAFRNVATASKDLGPLLENARRITEELAPAARDLRATVEKLPGTMDNVNGLVTEADLTIAKAGATVEELSAQLKTLLAALQVIVSRDLDPTLANINTTAEGLPAALASLQVTLRRVDQLVAAGQEDVSAVLGNVRVVSQDAEILTGYAKKYPAHILFGNPPPQRERK